MRRTLLVVAAGSALATFVSCTDDAAGPQAVLAGQFAVVPNFGALQGGIVEIARGRFVLTRIPGGAVAKDTVIPIPAAADSVDLSLSVPVLTPGETFNLTITLISSAGDTVFRGGPIVVTPGTSGTPVPVPVPFTYVGTGANAAGVRIVSPDTSTFTGEPVLLTAEAFDGSSVTIPGTPVGWTSLDTGRVQVTADPQYRGVAVGGSQRGVARLVATLVTGQRDTVLVSNQPLPTAIVAESGAGQSARTDSTLAQPLVARVTAGDGLGVRGLWVRFAVASGAGSLSADSVRTDSAGRAGVQFTLARSFQPHVVTATTPRLGSAMATFAASLVFEPPDSLEVVAGDGQSAVAGSAVAVAPQVRVLDAGGLPVPGVTVTFAVAGGGGGVAGATPVTDTLGLAAVTSWTLGTTAGPNTLTATVGSLTVGFTATGIAGPATQLVLVSGDTQSDTAGATLALPLVVRAADASGNPVTGATVTWSAGAGAVVPPSVVTDGTGLAQAAWTLGTTVGAQAATAALQGTALTVGFTATATPATPARLAFTVEPSDVARLAPITPAVVVTAYDGFANIATQFTGNVVLSILNNPGGGTLGGTTTAAAVAGVATFGDLTIDRAGTGYTLLAAGTGLEADTSAALDVIAVAGAITWINPAGGNWSDAANWSAGYPPTGVDTAVIALDGTYTVALDLTTTVARLVVGGTTGVQTVAQGANTFTVTGTAAFGATASFNLAGGSFSAAGLTNAGAMIWSGGTITGSGTVANSGTLTLSGGGTKTLGAGVTLANTGTMIAEAGTLAVAGGFTHAANAVLQGSGTLDLSGATTAAIDGTINPGTSPGLLSIAAPAGLALGTNAVINIELAGATTAGTDFDQLRAMNQPLTLGGTLGVTLTAPYTPSGGESWPILTGVTGSFATVNLPTGVGDTATRNDTLFLGTPPAAPPGINQWIPTGGLWSDPAKWSLGRVPIPGDTVELTQGLDYAVTMDVSATVAKLTIGGTGDVISLNIGDQTLTITDPGPDPGLDILPLGSIQVGNGGILAERISNQGSVRWAGTSATLGTGTAVSSGSWTVVGGQLTVNGEGAFDFQASGLLRLENDATMIFDNGFLTYLGGTIAGGLTTGNALVFTNGAELGLQADLAFDSLVVALVNGRIQYFNGDERLTIGPDAGITMDGTALAEVTAIVQNQGVITATAGTANYVNDSLYNEVGGVIAVNATGAPVRLAIAGTNNLGTVSLFGDQAGTLQVSGLGGALTNRTGASLVTTGSGAHVFDGILVNESGAAVTIGSPLTVQRSSAFGTQHVNGGTMDVAGGNLTIALTGSGATFTNQGSLDVTGGNVTVSTNGTSLAFTNEGTISVESPRSFSVSNSAGGAFTNAASGVLQGTGTFNVTGGSPSVSNLGTIAPGLSPGVLTWQGNLPMGSTSAINVEVGGTTPGTGYDQLSAVGYGLTFDGTLNVSFINGFIPAPGDRFAVMTFGSRAGTFASISLPTIPGRTLSTLFAESGTTDTLFVTTATGLCGGTPNSLPVVTVSLTSQCTSPDSVPTAAEAVSLVQPGGIVRFESTGGTIPVGGVVALNKPVRFQPGDAGTPMLSSGGSTGFQIGAFTGTITFAGLAFTVTGGIGIFASGYDQVIVDSSTFNVSGGGQGMQVGATTVPGGKVTVRNSTFALSNAVLGLFGANAGSVMDIINNSFSGPSSFGAIQFQSGATGRIEGNLLLNSGSSGLGRINVLSAPGVVVTGNTIETAPGLGMAKGIRVNLTGATNAVITNNQITGGFSGGSPTDPASYGFTGAGIELMGTGDGTQIIRGNTITGAATALLGTSVGGSVAPIRNNVLETVLTGFGGVFGTTALDTNDVTNYVNPFAAGFAAGQLTCNWWGDATGPQNAPGGTDPAVYTPWATGPIANGAGGLCDGVPAVPQVVFAGDSVGGLSSGIFSVNPDGTGQFQITTEGPPAELNVHPRWSPDRSVITYSARQPGNPNQLHIRTADGQVVYHLTSLSDTSTFRPRYSPDGKRLAFACGDGGYPNSAQDVCAIADVTNPFDGMGDGAGKTYVTDAVGSGTLGGSGAFAWNPFNSDQLAVSRDTVNGQGQTGSQIFLVNFDGTNVIPLTTTPILEGGNGVAVYDMDWAPDGSFIAFEGVTLATGERAIFRVELSDGTVTKLTTPGQVFGADFHPVVSPNSGQILFGRTSDGWQLMQVPSSGGGEFPMTPLLNFGIDQGGWDWSPDGSEIVLTEDVTTLSVLISKILPTTTSGSFSTDVKPVGRRANQFEVQDRQPTWRP